MTGKALMFVFVLLLVIFWSCALYYRIRDGAIQRMLLAMSSLMVFWMVIRIVKLLSLDVTVVRYLWYLYYVPFLFLPMILLWIGLETSGKETKARTIMKWGSFVLCSLLLLAVLTNDLHGMVFHLNVGFSDLDDYSYRFIYYIIFAWSLIMFVLFVIFSMSGNKIRLNPKMLYLVLVLAAMIAYFAGYVMKIPFFMYSEVSAVYCMFALMMIEVSRMIGLIEGNRHYLRLIKFAAMDVRIFDKDGREVFRTAGAAKAGTKKAGVAKAGAEKAGAAKAGAAKADARIVDKMKESDEAGTKTLYHKLRGGMMIETLHLGEVQRLSLILRIQNETLAVQRDMMTRVQEARTPASGHAGSSAAAVSEEAIFGEIERLLEGKIKKIETIADANMGSGDKQTRSLAKIKFLVNYCKRRGDIALNMIGEPMTNTDALALWLREALTEAEHLGIEGLLSQNGKADISVIRAAQLYDSFYEVLEHAIDTGVTSVVVSLETRGGEVIMRVATEMPGEEMKTLEYYSAEEGEQDV
jgi:hypothetical protein